MQTELLCLNAAREATFEMLFFKKNLSSAEVIFHSLAHVNNSNDFILFKNLFAFNSNKVKNFKHK